MAKSKNFAFIKTLSVAFLIGTLAVLTGCGNQTASSGSASSASSMTTSNPTSSTSSPTSSVDVPVTGISVTGAGGISAISSLHGTLQVSASVLPSDATDKSVTWSVINGTGTATINSTGLLTAVTDGSVTAKAVSVSTPTINGTLVVVITNQPAQSKTTLIADIEAANSNKSTATVSVDGSDVYPDAKWVTSAVMASYVAAIAAAQAVVDDGNATQDNVDDAVTAILSATATYNAAKADGIKVAVKTALNAAISAANANKTSAVVSVDGHDVYPDAKWVTSAVMLAYTNAIAAAQLVADKAAPKQDEVDTALATLATATATFNAAKADGIKVADKTALNADIIIANSNKSTATVSVDGSDVYPDAKWVTSAVMASYVAAIAAAQLVADKAAPKQDEVDTALATLATATATFNAAKADGIKVAVKTALNAAISAANANKISVTISTDGANVLTTDKWVTSAVMLAYINAIAAAQLVADKAAPKQDEVDTALATLATATATFNAAKADGLEVAPIEPSIDLGSSGGFVALAKTGISTTGSSVITGDIGVSPVAATSITGFSLVADASNEFATSSYVTGKLYASNYAEPTPTYLTGAVSSMETAFTTGMGIAPTEIIELYAGDLSGQTLTKGVYKWGTDVLINTDVTLEGSATDTWIFQVSGKLTEAENVSVILSGGALAKNIYWVVSDTVAVGVGSSFEGTVLAQVNVSAGTGSSINGRLLSQTAVTLDATTLTFPS